MRLAKVGYESYAEKTGGKTFDGRQMPKWEELPSKIQEAWEAATHAIVEAQVK